ncbi:MAG: THUMP domain-containing protein [Candidatus Thermoplasmatota archaeon]|nr:THUMP domain-containing protein [Candidatus Thermoplasmatota archaeon]
MQIMVELSGEHPTLPIAELLSCFYSFKPKIVLRDERIAVIAVPERALFEIKKLAFSRHASKFMFSSPLAELLERTKNINLESRTFRVRVKKIGAKIQRQGLEAKVGSAILASNSHSKVDLSNPQSEIRVAIVGNKCYVGESIIELNRKALEARKPQYRPFFSPISLHPRIARALVNLSRVKEGEILVDPFCGTGGILIEAGLIGLRIVGCDIDMRMVEGTKKNLEFFNIRDYELFQADVGEITKFIKSCDAIVTDPPYGRSATTRREKVLELYQRAFKCFKKILKEGKYLVVVLPNQEAIELGTEYFKLAEIHNLRVHKSLMRNICVYKN